MPASYRIDIARRPIFSTGSGVLRDDNLLGHQKQLLRDPEFDPSFSQLWDFQEVTKAAVTTDLVKELAGSRSYAPGTKRAARSSSRMARVDSPRSSASLPAA